MSVIRPALRRDGRGVSPPPALGPNQACLVTARLLRPENPGKNFFTLEQWQAISNALDLSDREREVTVFLVEGLSRQEIAARLHKSDGSSVSTQTVRVYIDRIFQKAQVSDRLELVLRLVRVHREILVPTPHGPASRHDSAKGRSPASR